MTFEQKSVELLKKKQLECYRKSFRRLIDPIRKLEPDYQKEQLEIMPMTEADKLRLTNKSLISELETLQDEIKDLKAKKFARFNNDERWIFEDSEEDHLESLVCPVVISPEKLVEIINRAEKSEKRAAAIELIKKSCDPVTDGNIDLALRMIDSGVEVD